MTGPVLNLDDTSRCALAERCERCGTHSDDLAVATAGTELGVYCLTLCDGCADDGRLPGRSAAATVRAVLAHCEHLDCDLDRMAATWRGEQR